MNASEYTPGDWYAVVSGAVVLLLAPSTPPEVVRDVWASAPEQGGLGGRLDALVRHGIGGLHPFAAVDLTGPGVQTALRGDVEVEVVRGTRAEVLTAPDVVSWSERSTGAAEEVTIRVAGAPRGSSLPIVSGVVRASRVRVRVTAESATAVGAGSATLVVRTFVEPVATVAAPAAASATAVPETDVVEIEVADLPAGAEGAATLPAEAGAAPVLTAVAPAVGQPDAAAPVDPAAAARRTPADPAPVAEPVVEETGSVPAVALPDAVADRVPAPAWPASETPAWPTTADLEAPGAPDPAEEIAAAPLTAPATWLSAPAPAARSLPVPSVPDAAAEPAAAEAVVPADQEDRAEVAPAPALPALPGPASADDHDGLTILSGELASIRQNLPSWAVSQTGDWPSGPVDPAASPQPVSVGAAGPASTYGAPGRSATTGALPLPAPAPTASAPRLLLSTGEVVPVDRPVLLGRSPQPERAPAGARLVAVPSPEQDISRSHAQVHVEQDRVLVTDLYSTNGVTVASGPLPPRRITAGEPVAVGSGDVVDLGDGVTFTVEPGA
ncbi:MAG TPA: FHA domain-containing protein [Cellulomonas sp.]